MKNNPIAVLSIILLLTTCTKDSTSPNDNDDNNTDELTYTITAEQTIDATGGTLTEPNSNVSIVVPQGALDGAIKLEVGPAENVPINASVHVPDASYHFGPDGQAFNKPVLMTIPYDPSTLPSNVTENDLQIHFYDKYSDSWSTVGDSINTQTNEVYGYVDHFCFFNPGGNIVPVPVSLNEPTNPTGNSITLSWTQNVDADFHSYRIYYSTTANVTNSSTLAATITNQNQTTYTVTNLQPQTPYYFVIYVFDTGDLNNKSNEKSKTTLEISGPDAVTLYDPTNITSTSVDISWSKSNEQDFQSYTVYYSTSSNVTTSSTPVSTITDNNQTTATITGLTPETTYYIRVFVFTNDGLIAGSNVKSVTTEIQQAVGNKWIKTYSTNGYSVGKSLIRSLDGNYVMTGTHSDGGFWLIKVDLNGEIVWDKSYRDGEGITVIQTKDGGYIICGWDKIYDNGFTDYIIIIKTDGYGNEEWTRIYGGEFESKGISIVSTDDGGYIVCGITYPFVNGETDTWIIKINNFGEILWDKTFGGIGDDTAISIISAHDGRFIFCGNTNSVNGFTEYSSAWIVKIDNTGNIIWERTLHENGTDFYLSEIIQAIDDGYIAVGTKNRNPWLLKVDLEGNKIWDAHYGGHGGSSVCSTIDNGYVITGSAYNDDYDVILIKTDIIGTQVWKKTFDFHTFDFSDSVIQADDGGYVICGGTGSDAFIIKTDSEGNYE